jgi:hypothetical protein
MQRNLFDAPGALLLVAKTRLRQYLGHRQYSFLAPQNSAIFTLIRPGDEGAQGLAGRSLHVADQHDISVRCTAIHYELLAVSGDVETLDEFAVEVSLLFGRRTRNRLAPDIRNATLESDV